MSNCCDHEKDGKFTTVKPDGTNLPGPLHRETQGIHPIAAFDYKKIRPKGEPIGDGRPADPRVIEVMNEVSKHVVGGATCSHPTLGSPRIAMHLSEDDEAPQD